MVVLFQGVDDERRRSWQHWVAKNQGAWTMYGVTDAIRVGIGRYRRNPVTSEIEPEPF